jgi:hypothetical protein
VAAAWRGPRSRRRDSGDGGGPLDRIGRDARCRRHLHRVAAAEPHRARRRRVA